MNILQNKPHETTLLLLGSYGEPISGVTAPGLSLRYKKFGDLSLTTLSPLPASMWREMGGGFYTLQLPSSMTDKVGSLFYELFGAAISPVYNEVYVIPNPTTVAVPGRCVISGSIVDLAGEAVVVGPRISLRMVDGPYAVDGAFIQGGHYETRPDAYGNFSISLVKGIKVVVEVEQLGIKHVITVPDSDSALLLDLLPPLC